MSPTSPSRCSYEYEALSTIEPDERDDVDRPDTRRCPHAVADPDRARCIFHLGNAEFPRDRITDEFLETLADENVDPNFAGAHLDGLALDEQAVTTASGAAIDLRGATIHGDVELSGATVEVPILLDSAAITGEVRAAGTTFEAPVCLVGADIRGGIFVNSARFEGGLFANGLDAGYVDGRDLRVDGSLVLSEGTFSSSVKLARATVDGDFTLTGSAFDWHFDTTAFEVTGDCLVDEVKIDGELDVIAATIGGDVDARKLSAKGDVDVRHAEIGGDITATDASFDGRLAAEDVTCHGSQLTFAASRFAETADFSSLAVPDGRATFADARFDGEAWFTHAHLGATADFSGVEFHDEAHLRDATFEEDLIFRNVSTTHGTYLHGSTIDGDADCSDGRFEHFQFSATVRGKADFSRSKFVESAIFRKSSFGDRVWFDDASFAGHPDFTDTRFTGETTFEETEFLVEPTFDGTRFAHEPDLQAAEYLTPAAVDLDERRRNMILAHPETLRHTGEELSTALLTGDLLVPASASHLIEDNLHHTKMVTKSLAGLDAQEWYTLFEKPLRTARTAAAQLPDESDGVLVFGLRVNPGEKSGSELLEEVIVAGVYADLGASVVFGHLDPDLSEIDYLVPIPGSDEAFAAGPSVGTIGELRHAIVRNQMYRGALLAKRDDEKPPVNRATVPVIVGAGRIGGEENSH